MTEFNTINIKLKAPPKSFADSVFCTSLGKSMIFKGENTGFELADDEFAVLVALNGGFECIIDENVHIVNDASAVIFSGHNQVILSSLGENTTYRYITIKGNQLERILSDMLEGNLPVFSKGMHCLELSMGSDFSKLDDEAKTSDFNPLELSASAFRLLTLLYGKNYHEEANPYPELVINALQYMRAELMDIYGVEDVADAMEVSKEHLIRVFTKATGNTVGKYLTSLRISRAKSLLTTEDFPLEVLATASGFSSASYFCKVFRKETGMTPKEYSGIFATGKSQKNIGDIYL